MIVIPLFNKDSSSDIATTGIYRFVFGIDASRLVDIPYANRKTITIPFVAEGTVWTEKKEKELFVYLSFNQSDATRKIEEVEAKVPMLAVYAVLGIIGLGVGSLFLLRVERVIDNPAIEIGIIAVAIFAVVMLIRQLRKK